MLVHQFGELVQAAVPVLARLVRVDGGGVDQLARGVADGHFHAGADAGVEPHDHARAGRGSQQQVAQVVGKDLDGYFFGVVAQAGEQVALGGQTELDAPGPGHALAQQVVGGAGLVRPAQVQRDAALGQARCCCKFGSCWRRLRLGQHQFGIQNLQLPPTEHGQRAVAGDAADGFVVVVVVAEFGDFGVVLVLAGGQLALQQPFGPQPFAQGLHQRGVFSPALGEDVAHAIEHGGHRGEVFAALAFFGFHEELGGFLWVKRGIAPQLIGQRLDAEFARDHALGAALGLVGQVQVFQLLLGRRGLDRDAQLGRQLALLLDAFQDGGAALV